MRLFCSGKTITSNCKQKILISLRTHDKYNSPYPKFYFSKFTLGISPCISQIKKNIHCKRASSGATQGSMTVEAAMLVPIFIFCVVNLLFGIQIIETSSRITASLHEVGNEICSFGYAIDEGVGEGVPSGIASSTYAVAAINKKLGSTVKNRGGIKGGLMGINYLGTNVMSSGGIVKISMGYSLKYPIDIGIRTYRLGTSYYGHAWVGYEADGAVGDNDEDDPIVYVTPNGTAYHTDRDCVYLNPSISSISSQDISQKRNTSGDKYYACEICGGGIGIGVVYITSYGTRYHSNLHCSGLKRTISAIHLSEVGGRHACSKCG